MIYFNSFSIIVITLTTFIGLFVFVNNKDKNINRIFLLLTLSIVFWILTNYLTDISTDINQILILSKATLVGPIISAYLFYKFSVIFPRQTRNKYSDKFDKVILFSAFILILLAFTQYNIKSVFIPTNGVPEIVPGLLYIPSLFYFIATMGLSMYYLFKDFHIFNDLEKKQVKSVTLGMGLLSLCALIINLILPLLGHSEFVNWGPYFSIILIIFMTYAIFKHHLFNIKVITTEFVTFLLWTFILMRTLISTSVHEKFINGGLFLVTVFVGTLLIRSVFKEVEQKEELAKLNTSLQNLMKQRESLVHLITHKVKGSFTHSKYIFDGMLSGTYGAITPELKMWAEKGIESDNVGIDTVDMVLNVANMQKGLIKYEMKKTDFKDIVFKTFSEKKVPAETKGLKIEKDIKDGDYFILGDAFWMKEAINNLLENSIKYTKEGSITLELKKLPARNASGIADAGGNDKILLSVKDTGVGITEEDKKNLFTEGGRGKESVKVNVDSTGYGLYTVKLIIEAHNGRVWVESEGEGKGSTFFIELPLI